MQNNNEDQSQEELARRLKRAPFEQAKEALDQANRLVHPHEPTLNRLGWTLDDYLVEERERAEAHAAQFLNSNVATSSKTVSKWGDKDKLRGGVRK